MHCWRCAHAIDPTDLYCRACGEGQGRALAWYYRPLWILVLALTALGPFAVVLIMRTPLLGRTAKWTAALGLVALFLWLGWEFWVATESFLEVV